MSNKSTIPQRYIRIGTHLTPVNEEIYLAYHRSKRRERYYARDIKTETPIRDKSGAVTGYRPSREDSLERLNAACANFPDASIDVEAQAIGNVLAEKLHEVLALLTAKERSLIEALFFANGGTGMSEREYAEISGIPRKTINNHRRAILAKLKKLFGK